MPHKLAGGVRWQRFTWEILGDTVSEKRNTLGAERSLRRRCGGDQRTADSGGNTTQRWVDDD
jgi:hypothetical protein